MEQEEWSAQSSTISKLFFGTHHMDKAQVVCVPLAQLCQEEKQDEKLKLPDKQKVLLDTTEISQDGLHVSVLDENKSMSPPVPPSPAEVEEKPATRDLVVHIRRTSKQPKKRVTIQIPDDALLTVYQVKHLISNYCFRGLPTSYIIITDKDGKKLYTPGTFVRRSEVWAINLQDPPTDLVSYEVDARESITPHFLSIKPYPDFSPEEDEAKEEFLCDVINVLDTNCFLFPRKPLAEWFAPNVWVAITWTVRDELKHLDQDTSKLMAQYGLRFYASKSFLLRRKRLLFDALYKYLIYNTRSKKCDGRFPLNFDEWESGEEEERASIENARNDVFIWLECFVLARRSQKPVVLHTWDGDFERFDQSIPEVRDILLSTFPESVLKRVSIIRH